MKIAFVYDAIYPYIKGGAEKRIYELARHLCKRHEVHLFGMKLWEGPNVIKTEDGVFLHGVCPAMKLYIKGRRSILEALRFSFRLIFPLLREDFDVIECSSAPYFHIFACKLYSILRKRPLTIYWLEYWGNLWNEYLGIYGFLGKTVESLASRMSKYIVANSEHTRQSLIKAGLKENEVTTIEFGLRLQDIEFAEASNDKSDIIFAGRLIKEKKVDILLRAIKEVVNHGIRVKCNIVGDGPEKECLQNLSKELGLESFVFFLGFLDSTDKLYSLMKSSKVFVFPSVREGFGIVVIEANACGLPVIAVKAEHNAISSLIVNEKNGFICELDPGDIAKSTALLLTDNNLYSKMHKMAIESAKGYGWSALVERQEQYYYKVISSYNN